MYGPGPVPFNDGCAVASMDLSTEYEVILLTSEGRKVRCKSGLTQALKPDNFYFCGGAFIKATNMLVNLGRSKSTWACTSCTSRSGLKAGVQVSVLP